MCGGVWGVRVGCGVFNIGGGRYQCDFEVVRKSN